MPFNPEKPRTEDREFHPSQETLDGARKKLQIINDTLEDGLPAEGESREAFGRSLEVIEEVIAEIKEKLG